MPVVALGLRLVRLNLVGCVAQVRRALERAMRRRRMPVVAPGLSLAVRVTPVVCAAQAGRVQVRATSRTGARGLDCEGRSVSGEQKADHTNHPTEFICAIKKFRCPLTR